jgi:hypothetical protein
MHDKDEQASLAMSVSVPFRAMQTPHICGTLAKRRVKLSVELVFDAAAAAANWEFLAGKIIYPNKMRKKPSISKFVKKDNMMPRLHVAWACHRRSKRHLDREGRMSLALVACVPYCHSFRWQVDLAGLALLGTMPIKDLSLFYLLPDLVRAYALLLSS